MLCQLSLNKKQNNINTIIGKTLMNIYFILIWLELGGWEPTTTGVYYVSVTL